MANPRRAPILRTKSVRKKQMNKCMAEIKGPVGIRTRDARTKANTITIELRRILSNAVLGIVFKWEAAMLEGVVSRNNTMCIICIMSSMEQNFTRDFHFSLDFSFTKSLLSNCILSEKRPRSNPSDFMEYKYMYILQAHIHTQVRKHAMMIKSSLDVPSA